MKWLLLLLSLALVGCVHTPKTVYVNKYVLIPVECEDFGRIDGIRPLPVKFVKATTEDGYTVLGLRGDMYSNLSIVFADTSRYLEEQMKAIDYYKNCIEVHNSIELNEKGEPK